jgi:Na+/H+ antiporter NhaD/arsenite permease-like protein
MASHMQRGWDMEQGVAYSALAATIGLAVARPRLGPRLRFTPGTTALAGVLALVAARLLTPRMMLDAARVQWRPLATMTSIMTLTGVVQEVGAFDRLAARIERRARTRSAASTFTLVFALGAADAVAAQQRRGDPDPDPARRRARAPALPTPARDHDSVRVRRVPR